MKEIEKIEKIEKMIEDVCKETFEILHNIYQDGFSKNETRTRLVIPKDRKGEIRLGEQELRFVFVERLNRNEYFIENNLFYSIETPTELKYKFKGENKPKDIPDWEDGGRSARYDLVIFNSCGKKVALIEFKATNEHYKVEYQEDCFKLREGEQEQDDVARYFIQILEASDNGTIQNIHEKLFEDDINYETYFDKDKINYICYTIEDKRGTEHNGKRVEQDILNFKK